LFLVLLLNSCDGQTKSKSTDSTVKVDQSYRYKEDYEVSLIRLIANPEKYDGKHIKVIGFLNLEFEGDAIYLHKEDYQASISKNGLWVDISRGDFAKYNKCNKKYVILEGVFDAEDTGHMGLFGGAIKNITRVEPWQ